MSKLVSAAVVILCFAVLTNFALADDRSGLPEVESLRVGLANHYKLGCWTPVDVTLGPALGDAGASGQLELQAPDGDGVPARFTGPRLDWTLGGNHLVYVDIGRAHGAIDVSLRKQIKPGQLDESETLQVNAGANPPVAVPATNEFMVELGASIGLQKIFRRVDDRHVDQATVVTVDKPQRLPDQWYGYEGVDLLVIAGLPAVENLTIDAPAVDAIEHWVRLGGTLLVACGERAEKIFGKDAPLARFAPGEFDRTIDLPSGRFGAIESFAATEEGEKLEVRSLRAAQWKHVTADRIELNAATGQSSLPLVMHSALGFGQVIVVGLDLHDKSPLADWPARTKFLERVLARKTQRAGQTNGAENFSQGKRLGFINISGQLRAALDQFDAVEFVPFWAVAGTALVLIGLLFPLNYLMVHRWLNRQWLAWFVFAASIIAFSAGAYAWANRAKGNGLHVNQVDLVDVDLRDGRVRGTTWFNLFSPENSRFDLKLAPDFAGMLRGNDVPGSNGGSNCLLTCLGLAGEGLGGMSSRAANAPLFDEPYTINTKSGDIEGAPVAIWSSKSFVARWESHGGGIHASLSATAGGKLQGTLVNQLEASLRDCVVFFGDSAYPLGVLELGQTVRVERVEVSALSVLTNRSVSLAQQQPPPYDRAGFEATRILQVMMFYDLAGGSNYTGLLNRYQSFVDLSNQLNFGRAILVGHGRSGAMMQINGQPLEKSQINQHDTVYRFLLPVKNTDRDSN